jgi:cell wall-associated NlpC family hydrolase
MAQATHPLAAKVIAAAKKYADEGYTEGKNNNTSFGKWYGMNYQPWCAMFVSGCFNEAGLVNLVAASTKKGFASCDAGASWFAKNKRIVPIGQAEPGDIVFFNFDKNPTDTEHVGIVVKNNKRTKTLVTIEGNTSGDRKGSQANGDGVFKKKRSYSLVMSVARPDWDAPAPKAAAVKKSAPTKRAAPVKKAAVKIK